MTYPKKLKLPVREFEILKDTDTLNLVNSKDFKLGDSIEVELESKGSKGANQTLTAHVTGMERSGNNDGLSLRVQKWTLKETKPKSFFSSGKTNTVHYIYVSNSEFDEIKENKYIPSCSQDREFEINDGVKLIRANTNPLEYHDFIIDGIHLSLDHSNDKVDLSLM